ncbi:hypothetical protein O1L55_01510 [Streptomyces albulus]|nr:hypothetical protein [Streptomyces noursei]
MTLAVHRARAVLQRPRVRRRLDQATGGCWWRSALVVGFEVAS